MDGSWPRIATRNQEESYGPPWVLFIPRQRFWCASSMKNSTPNVSLRFWNGWRLRSYVRLPTTMTYPILIAQNCHISLVPAQVLLSKAIRPKRASTNRSSSGRQSQDHPDRTKIQKEHLQTPWAFCRLLQRLEFWSSELSLLRKNWFSILLFGNPNPMVFPGPGRPGGEPGARKSACSKSAPASRQPRPTLFKPKEKRHFPMQPCKPRSAACGRSAGRWWSPNQCRISAADVAFPSLGSKVQSIWVSNPVLRGIPVSTSSKDIKTYQATRNYAA